jgi:hypothetical protein
MINKELLDLIRSIKSLRHNRILASKILKAANMISNNSRRGSGNYIILSPDALKKWDY